MLWRKAWLECKYRFLLCFVMSAALGLSAVVQVDQTVAQKVLGNFAALASLVGPLGALILAGSGINTQTNWGMLQGFHPSMYFLLSMPVAREKLLRVRALMGLGLSFIWIAGTAALIGLLETLAGRASDWTGMISSLPNLLVGTTVFYMLTVWLTAFLDEFWAGMVSLTVMGMFAGYGLAGGPSWFNTAKFMTAKSLLGFDGMAWLQALAYLTLSAIFYWLAKRTVERREY